MTWFQKNKKNIVIVLSFVLHLLGGTGLVKPVIDLRPQVSASTNTTPAAPALK